MKRGTTPYFVPYLIAAEFGRNPEFHDSALNGLHEELAKLGSKFRRHTKSFPSVADCILQLSHWKSNVLEWHLTADNKC